MIWVAFDTSTESCSVGVQVGDEVRVDHRLVQREHAALLLPMLSGLLSEFELKPAQIEGVVFGRGPGSFTGVRIAAAAAQGLAVAADCGVYGVSSLQAMARGCVRARVAAHTDKPMNESPSRSPIQSTETVLVAIDARMDQVYSTMFDASVMGEAIDLTELTEEAVVAPDAFALPVAWNACEEVESDNRAGPSQNIVLCGGGAERYETVIQQRLHSVTDAKVFTQADIYPHAEDLLALARAATSQGSMAWQTADKAQPVYLRNKVALTEAERSSA